jgi:hypothetical protein
MKRILFVVTMTLVVFPSATKAWIYDYSPIRYRTGWSPYAFTHKRSGLISGYYGYSPYAFSHKSSGLIPRDVRYSPYAFTHKSSGLIYEHIGYSPYAYDYRHSGLIDRERNIGQYGDCAATVTIIRSEGPARSGSYDARSHSNTGKSYNTTRLSRRERIRMQMDSRKQIETARHKGMDDIIYDYLKSIDIDDFKMTGVLKIEGTVINANFLIEDKNLMITYWNMDEVKSLAQQQGYQRRFLEKHKTQWTKLCNQYKQAGGKVYPVTSADENEILARLILCPELNSG